MRTKLLSMIVLSLFHVVLFFFSMPCFLVDPGIFLVGGFNPSEKIVVKMGSSSPILRGESSKNI